MEEQRHRQEEDARRVQTESMQGVETGECAVNAVDLLCCV